MEKKLSIATSWLFDESLFVKLRAIKHNCWIVIGKAFYGNMGAKMGLWILLCR